MMDGNVPTENFSNNSANDQHQLIDATINVNQTIPLVDSQPLSSHNHPNVCDDTITGEPTEGNNFPDEDEETPESLALVEQVLSSAHFKEAGGFSLEYSCVPCCPSLSVTPTLGCYPISVRARGWETSGSSISGCFCCCVPTSNNWQTITLKQNENEVLNFMYRPRIWCFDGKQERIIDMYIPQREKRIGWIKHGDKFGDGAVLVDCVTKSIYIVKKIETESDVIAMHVISSSGMLVAVAQATRGWRSRGFLTWSEFEMKYSPSMIGPANSAVTKSAILVAFAMWVLTYREDTLRRRMTWYLILILVVVGFFVIIGLLT